MKAKDWILSADKLPANSEDVLVYDDAYGIQVASYERYCWICYEYGILEHVTHWQPLALPPMS